MGANELNTIMRQIVDKAVSLYGNSLERVMLFGSYARGDFVAGSDLDVALFLRCEPVEIVKRRDTLIDETVFIDLEYGISTSYRIIPIKQWAEYKDALDLYINIDKEGVSYYERKQ